MTQPFDHVVIGAGHNGLVCATLLAKAGRRVLVLEARDTVGGMATTREFAPGFRVSACAHLLYALPEELARELAAHGLEFAATDLATYALNPDGAPLVFQQGTVVGVDERDARAYAQLRTQMARFARVLARVLGMEPFRVTLKSWRERIAAGTLALSIRLLGKRQMREFLRIVGMNAYDLLTENFESALLKGALAFDATQGAEHGARSPGSVLTLLYRVAGLAGAGRLGTAQPRGGMGAVSAALAARARKAGVEIRTGSPVARITVVDDRAVGVLLASGEEISARSVISNADPKATFLKLLGPGYLDTDFVRRIDHFRAKGAVAKVHLALEGLPAFRGVPAAALGARLLVSPSMDYLEGAFNPSKYRELPEHPVLEITVPTQADPGLAPAGKTVLSINVMFVPYDLKIEAHAAREQLGARVEAVLEDYAPGIGALVSAREVLLPGDLEREFGAAGGHWHHGALAFDQFFFTRPVPGAAGYTTPVAGLHLCGAGSHPGGGVMGTPGRNAARKILKEGSPHAR